MGRMSLKAGPLIRMNSCLKYQPEGARLLRRTVIFFLAVPVTGHILERSVTVRGEVFGNLRG
jgi:hypothetical protein